MQRHRFELSEQEARMDGSHSPRVKVWMAWDRDLEGFACQRARRVDSTSKDLPNFSPGRKSTVPYRRSTGRRHRLGLNRLLSGEKLEVWDRDRLSRMAVREKKLVRDGYPIVDDPSRSASRQTVRPGFGHALGSFPCMRSSVIGSTGPGSIEQSSKAGSGVSKVAPIRDQTGRSGLSRSYA